MSIGYKWIKFTNYADELLNGLIYLNPLEYYRGIEKIIDGDIDKSEKRNDAINDYLEGSIASVSPDDLDKYGLGFLNEVKDALVGGVHLLSEDLKYLKVFCLYTLLFDSENKIVWIPSEKVRKFGHQYAVFIYNPDAFVKRIIDCLDKHNGYGKFVAFNGNFVRYYNNDSCTKRLGVYNKSAEFEWEHEFRFIFPEQEPNLDPIVLDIGSIEDIATVLPIDELTEQLQLLFPDYQMMYSEKER